MKRIDALRVIDRVFGDLPLVVTCGATAREVDSLGRRDSRLLLLDSMGLTSGVGLGVALGVAGPVGIVDGDGSLLMGFSILPTLAAHAPANLTLIVLDNGQHASADAMPSQAAAFDLVRAIRGSGIETAHVSREDDLERALHDALAEQRLAAVVATIEPGNVAGTPFVLADPVVLADRFSRAIRSGGASGSR